MIIIVIIIIVIIIIRVTRVFVSGCHFVGVAAAGWLEFGSEYRCVRRAEIEEAPDDGKWH